MNTSAETKMTLEDKLLRLQEIKNMLVDGKVPLSKAVPLLEEAFGLKNQIELELKKIEDKLVDLSQ